MTTDNSIIDALLKLYNKYLLEKDRASTALDMVKALLHKEGFDVSTYIGAEIIETKPVVSKLILGSKREKAEALLSGITTQNLDKFTIPQQILFCLRELKSGTYLEVAEKLQKLNPDSFDIDKAEKDCRNHLSKMKVNGLIKCSVSGRKNTYFYPFLY
ncbi:MAG TPA: hypothetical protein PKD91_04085 [Bacteroidia bacterium]|nr:hypothetical protein [Bacteroidia bacterium]